jgi:hypothetical protein
MKVIWERFNVTYSPQSKAIKTEVCGMKVTALGWKIYRRIKKIIRPEQLFSVGIKRIRKTGMHTPFKEHMVDVVVTELQTLD